MEIGVYKACSLMDKALISLIGRYGFKSHHACTYPINIIKKEKNQACSLDKAPLIGFICIDNNYNNYLKLLIGAIWK